MNEFVIADVVPGKLNELVKNTMKMTGIDDPNEAVRAVNAGEWVLTKVAVLVLSAIIGTVSINATTEKFVAKNVFIKNTEDTEKVKISYIGDIGDNFTEWFLKGDSKVEEPTSSTILQYQDLKKTSIDKPIITELGGEAKAETTLMEMFHLMFIQKNGEEGVLLTNGYANIFYIRDINGVLRVVCVFWNDDGWGVHANSVELPNDWYDGARVFSRNSATV